ARESEVVWPSASLPYVAASAVNGYRYCTVGPVWSHHGAGLQQPSNPSLLPPTPRKSRNRTSVAEAAVRATGSLGSRVARLRRRSGWGVGSRSDGSQEGRVLP